MRPSNIGPLEIPIGDSSKDNIKKDVEEIAPLTMKQVLSSNQNQSNTSNHAIEVRRANMNAHKNILIQLLENNNSKGTVSQLRLNKLKFDKGSKQKGQIKRNNKINAKVAQSNEENIQRAKDDGWQGQYYFMGRYFNFNEEMKQKGEEFINFSWENYNHDDFLSYMVSHRKTIRNYLDFYKDHARHSNFLRTSTADNNQTKVHELKEHKGPVLHVIMNDTGTKVITACADSVIRFWDFDTKQNYEVFQGHEDAVTCLAISKDEKILVSGSRDRSIKVWPIENQADVVTKADAHSYWINALLLFNEDQKLVTAGSDKIIQIWNVSNLDSPLQILKGHEDAVLSLALMPDEKMLFSGSDDTQIKVWNMETFLEEDKYLMDGHYDGVTTLSISPDKSCLVSGSDDGYIIIWNLETFELKLTLDGHQSQVHSLYVTKNCKYIVSCSKDKTIKVWDLLTGMEKIEIEGHKGSINTVTGSFDNDYVISGADDSTVRITKLGINEDGQVLYCHDGKVNCLVICPTGDSIITAGDDNIKIYSLIIGNIIGEIGVKEKYNFSPVEVLTVTPSGEFLLAGNKKGVITLYNLEELKEIKNFYGHADKICALKSSHDGLSFFSGSADFDVAVWDISNEKNRKTLRGHTGAVNCLAVGKEQKRLYSGSDDKTIRVWDMSKLVCMQILEGHTGVIYSLAICVEKKRLFSGSSDQSIRVWNLNTFTEIKEKTMWGHTDDVLDLVLSRDAKFLYSASKDKTMQVWHGDSGRVERIIEGHEGDVKGVRITPDKQVIISASYDRTVRKWVNEVRDEDEQIILEGHHKGVNHSCLTKSNKYLISCSSDKVENIKVWDYEKFTEVRTLSTHEGTVNWVMQSRSEENIVYSAGEDCFLKVWNIETGEELQSLQQTGPISCLTITHNNKFLFLGLADSTIIEFSISNTLLVPVKTLPTEPHSGKINQMNVTKNDMKLVSVSDDSYMIVWNISALSCEKKIHAHQGPVLSVTSTNKVKNIISGGADSIIKIWDIDTGKEKMQLKGHKGGVFTLTLTPDDKKLLSGSEDLTIRVWRYKTGEQLNIILGHVGTIKHLFLDKEAKKIISSSLDKSIRIQELPDSEKEVVLRGHTNGVNCVAIFQDKNKAIIYTGSSDKTIKSWEFETGKQEKKFIHHKESVLSLCLTQDGRHMYSGSVDKSIIKWDVETEAVLHEYLGHRSHVFSVALDREEKYLVSASDDRSVRVWKIDDSESVREFEGHKLGVTCVCMSMDGYYIFSGSLDKTIRQWNIETGTPEQIFQDSQGNMQGVRTICTYGSGGASGSYLVSGGDDNFVRVWNIELCSVVLIFEGHKNPIFSVAIDAENKHIVSCGKDRTIRIWDLETGQESHVYYGHVNYISALALTNDSRQIVSASKDQTIRIWRFQKYERYIEIEGHEKSITDILLSPDNKYLISSSEDATIRVWNMETFTEERVLTGHKKAVRGMQLLVKPPLNLLISGSSDHTIRVWNWMDPELLDICLDKKHHEAVTCLALDPTNYYLASGSSDNTILIWALPDLSEIKDIQQAADEFRQMGFAFSPLRHKNTVNSLSFSSDGSFLVSGASDGLIILWDMYTGNLIKSFDNHGEVINDICITKDNKRIISGSMDKKIKVWNVLTQKEEKILTGHDGTVQSVFLSEDEKHILSGSDDYTIKIWNFETGFCEQTLEGHEDQITCIRTCKDGKRIVSGSDDETIKVWWVFDPNVSIISMMIEMLEMHSDDNEISRMYPKFKERVFSESIFPFHMSILHYYTYMNDSLAIERILNILDIQENKEFILTTDIFDKTPIDVAFELKNKRILNALFTYAINKPPPINGFPNFQYALERAIEFNLLNIEKIFDSRLIPLRNCLPYEDSRFHLPEETKMSSDVKTCSFNNYYIEAQALKDEGMIIDEEYETEITNRVEFLILDIPYIVDLEENELLVSLVDMDAHNLMFSSLALQSILNYKWKSYASFSYARDIIIFVIFLLILTVNSVFLFPNRIKESLDLARRDTFKTSSLVLNIILAVFTVYFIGAELFKLKRLGRKLYFSTVWHILDLITLVILSVTIILDLISISEVDFQLSWLKALLSINIFLLWIKFLSYARGYKQTAFMVRMILQVILDIKVFLAIFFILCLSIGFSIFVLQDSDQLDEMNYLAQFSIFNLVYRMILGDNGLYDDIAIDNNYLNFLLWIFFFITTLFMMIIMLNLLISILGDSYDKISGREVLANNYEKTCILYEIDATLMDVRMNILRKRNVFEKYLVIVKIQDELVDENQNERIRKKIDRIEEKIDGIEEKFKDINRKIREKNEFLESKMDKNQGNLETLIDNLQERVCSKIDLLEKVLVEKKKK